MFTKATNCRQEKKSYAVNFILEDKERTLTDTVINKVIGNILHNLESKLGAQQR